MFLIDCSIVKLVCRFCIFNFCRILVHIICCDVSALP